MNDDDGSTPAPKTQYGWSGSAHVEYTYGHLTLAAGSAGGNLTINGVKITGSNLELTVTTPNAASTHIVHQSPEASPTQWTPVPNVTWSPGNGGTLTAVFAKPTSARTFYRVAIP